MSKRTSEQAIRDDLAAMEALEDRLRLRAEVHLERVNEAERQLEATRSAIAETSARIAQLRVALEAVSTICLPLSPDAVDVGVLDSTPDDPT